jgi:hypothetical protein
MAKGTWCVLSILVGQLLVLGGGVWPELWVHDLDVLVQVLHATQELIAQTASVGQVLTCLLFPFHMVPCLVGHYGQDSVSPFLTAEVAEVII